MKPACTLVSSMYDHQRGVFCRGSEPSQRLIPLGKGPVEDPLCVVIRHIDAAPAHGLPKVIVPVDAVKAVLQPYQPEDARRVIQQLAVRRGVDGALLNETVVEEVLTLSGGHSGLMVALLSGLSDEPPANLARLRTWAQGLAKVHEECRKIYEGLREEEKAGLRALVHERAPGRKALSLLEQKGLIVTETGAKPIVFSPLFAVFLSGQTDTAPTGLQVDEQTGIVVVNGEVKPAFSGLIHILFHYLYSRVGEVCSRDEIIFELYPDKEGDVESNTIDALIGRLRKEIEVNPSTPQFIKTVRKRGYRLVLEPENE